VPAQTLADVAAKEKERRQTTAADGKVYSNKDLKETPTTAAASAPTAAPKDGEAKAPAKDGKDDGKSETKGGKAEPKADAKSGDVKDEKYWRERMTLLRAAVEHDKLFAESLQSRINALTADFVSRDDPAQRALIAIDREKALAELDRLKKAVDDDTVAIAAAEEDARRSGVPPGWLR
jgi:hypothetical protein